MDITWPDIIGGVGVLMILGAYAALQLNRMRAANKLFSLLNFLGASAILVSLFYDFNLPAFVIEAAWAAISLYGLTRKPG